MAINVDFLVAALDLSEVFLDKDTGAPLSGGQVFFFRDVDRVTPKLVYTIQRNNPNLPPAYSYVPLPNPITLSGSGQFQDNAGNNIPVYYYPVDANNQLDLYFIEVTNSNGVTQFTRQAWPPNESTIQPPPGGQASGISNQITNSQFIFVNFVPTLVQTYAFNGAGTTSINIAPGWTLNVTFNGIGQVQWQRTSITGNQAFPNNPPYTLTVTPGANITGLTLTQTLPFNPDVFSPPPGGANGWISASILLGPGNNGLSVSYQPNGQPAQPILNNVANGTAAPLTITNTVQLAPATNPSNSDVGFVNIVITLNPVAATTISNIQIVGLNSNVNPVPYDQRTANREQDFTFNYYNPLLQYKPIRSYLVGWDFPLNPAQFLGTTVPASGAGANNVQYVWDQTLIFSTANNGAAVSRSAAGNGALRVTATNATQFALIQYLPQSVAREILNDNISSMVTALTPQVGGLIGTITLWYTNNGALPSAGANNTFFTGLDATGNPTGVIAGWTQVPRGNLGSAQFTVLNSANTNFNNYGFNGWNALGVAGVNTATFFAIVVGFAQLGGAGTIDFKSISLVPGKIPTIPDPQTQSEVTLDCQFFYQKSFNIATVPATAATAVNSAMSTIVVGGGGTQQRFENIRLFTPMNINNYAITTYNPAVANAQVRNTTTNADCAGTGTGNQGDSSFVIVYTPDAGSAAGNGVNVHWTADARLGV